MQKLINFFIELLFRLFHCHKLYPVIVCVCVVFFPPCKACAKTIVPAWCICVCPAAVWFSARSSWVMCYRAKLSSVAKCLISFELLIFLGWNAKFDNIALLVLLSSDNWNQQKKPAGNHVLRFVATAKLLGKWKWQCNELYIRINVDFWCSIYVAILNAAVMIPLQLQALVITDFYCSCI